MNYWERWIGDWKRKTAHLSAEQKGVYGELLDHCYANECGLPAELEDCCRIAGATTKSERAAVERVLRDFFPDGINKRANEEITKRHAFVEKQRGNANRRWEAEANKPKPAARKSKGNGHDALAGFEVFWSAYPRHDAPARAEKAWKALKPNDELQARILARIEDFRASAKWREDGGQYIPYASKWLTDRGWEAEVRTAPKPEWTPL